MTEKSPTPSMSESEPKMLSFGEFINRDFYFENGMPRYNNFFTYFEGDGLVAGFYKQTEHYKRFTLEHPKLNASLCEKTQNRRKDTSTKKSLEPFERELYEAYKIMRSYGVSDEELFK